MHHMYHPVIIIMLLESSAFVSLIMYACVHVSLNDANKTMGILLLLFFTFLVVCRCSFT